MTTAVRFPLANNVTVEDGQQWAARAGAGYRLLEIVKVLPGRYLRPPDVALIPCEFARARWTTGPLPHREFDLRIPYRTLGGDGRHVLYRAADGTLTPFGEREERQLKLRTELADLDRRRGEILNGLQRMRWPGLEG